MTRLEELRRSTEEDLIETQLAAGEHRDVVAQAETLVTEEPFRERRWVSLALAHYRSGNQADALRALRRARHTLVEEVGVEPGPELVALERAVLDQDPGLVLSGRGTSSSHCPYKGLAPYDADDADVFFGRIDEAALCVERLSSVRLLVLAGPSGCGKSSLARAGIVPVLRRRGEVAVVVVPGADPNAVLGHALATTDGRAVVVVDQLEELFGGGQPIAAVGQFCSRLARYAVERAPVVLTIRSDHLGDLGAQPSMARLVEQGLHLVAPLCGDALRSTIEGPAALAGLRLEPGLVDLLVRDTAGQPAALPLLSHALSETWERREGRVLTVEGYRATGEIQGAIARTAEQLYASLPSDQQATLRALLLRLVSPTGEGEPVRTHVDRCRLTGSPDHDHVLDLLVRARLVTAGERTVALAHEAVARAWPRLRSWLEEDVAGQRVLRHLSASTDEWEALGRPATELYRGARLEAALEWSTAASPDLTNAERAFLDAAVSLDVSERQQVVARARDQARQNRRLRRALLGVAMILVAAIFAGVVAVRQRHVAQREQRESAMAALTSESTALRGTRRDVAALLALEAHRLSPSPATESALFGTFTSSPDVQRSVPTDVELGGFSDVDSLYLPGDAFGIVDQFGAVHVTDLVTGATSEFAPMSDESGVTHLALSNDGRFLATMWRSALAETDDEATLVTVWDLTAGRRRFDPVTVPFAAATVAINADGSLVAVSGGHDGRTVIYDDTGNAIVEPDALPQPENADLVAGSARSVFLPNGRLAIGSLAGPIRIVDATTGSEVSRIDAPSFSSNVFLVATADGRRLITVGAGTASGPFEPAMPMLTAMDLAAGRPLQPEPLVLPSSCAAFAYADRTDSLLCADDGGLVLSYGIGTDAQPPVRYDSQRGDVCSLALNHDSSRLASVSSCQAGTPSIVEWTLDHQGLISRLVSGDVEPHRNGVGQYGFGRDSTVLVAELMVAGSNDPVTHIVDGSDGTVLDRIPGAYALLPSNDPRRAVAIFAEDETIGWFDTGERRPAGPRVDPDVLLNGIWARDDVVLVGGYTDDGYRLSGVDLDTGRLDAPIVELADADIIDVAIAGDVFFAGGNGPDGPYVERRSVASGDVLARGAEGYQNVAVGGNVVIVSTNDGRILEVDPTTLEPIGSPFPGISGRAVAIALDDNGRRLMVHGDDRRLRIYDVSSRTQLGDAIDGVAPRGQGWSAIRPDGLQVAFDTTAGIAIWDLDPSRWIDAACEIAGRNLTRAEWTQYIGGLAPYHVTCSQWPAN